MYSQLIINKKQCITQLETVVIVNQKKQSTIFKTSLTKQLV